MKDEGKPVTLFVTENTAIDGEHVAKGTILDDVPPDLAIQLAGAGKVRLATKEDSAASKKPAK
jgi:hypothetical protein